MDPNAALEQIRELIDEIRWATHPAPDTESTARERNKTIRDALDPLVEHWDALDAWITRGGFLPSAWTVGRK